MEMLNFKGYVGLIEPSIADKVLHGKILFINDLVTYEAETVAELEKEFQAAVTDYVETCKAIGKAPEKSVSGAFNVRVGEELHRRALVRAMQDDKPLNGVVVAAMRAYLSDEAPVQNHVHNHVVKVTLEQSGHRWSTPGSEMQFIEPQNLYANEHTPRH